jgi:hypothetical protein
MTNGRPEGMMRNMKDHLAGTQQFDITNPRVVEALDSIEIEADWKIENFFSFIDDDSEIDFGRTPIPNSWSYIKRF